MSRARRGAAWRPVVLGILCGSLGTSVAHAGESEKTAAEVLFKQGRQLMESKRADEACPKFAESARLDPAAGTLLNLAECYEVTGRIASAWVRYKELRALANQRGQTERVERASAKIAELEPRLSFLRVRVTEETPGLTIVEDGVTLGRPAWGLPLPVDSGEHVVRASAPGRKPWETTVKVAGAQTEIVVPPLVREAATSDGVVVDPSRTPSSTGRTIAVVLLVSGGVAAVTSLGFGLGAKLENDKARSDECSATACTRDGVDRIDRAVGFGNVATGVGVGAALLLVTGVVLYLVDKPKTSRTNVGNAALAF